MRKLSNLKGLTFGNQEVISYAGHGEWNVVCIHGVERIIKTGNLKNAKACLCLAGYRDPKYRNKREISNQEAAINTLLRGYKLRAKHFDVTWNLSREIFKKLIFSPCHYCGAEGSNRHTRTFCRVGDEGFLLYNGLDRKNPAGGYVVANTLPCCWPCNRAKGLMNYEEFLTYVRRIVATENARKQAVEATSDF